MINEHNRVSVGDNKTAERYIMKDADKFIPI